MSLIPGHAELDLRPRADIRPTTPITIVRIAQRAGAANDPEGREALNVRWGLVPPWAQDLKIRLLHNARSDELLNKKSWIPPFTQGRRCLIVASGFYEWHTEGEGKKAIKTRHYITSRSGDLLAIAGLWERNANLGIESAVMITTEPNDLMVPIHDRMPAIMPPETWDAWLSPSQDHKPLLEMIRPAPTGDLVAYPVRADVRDEDSAGSLAARFEQG